MQLLNQMYVLTRVAIETIPERWGVSLVSIVGVASVVGIMLGILSLATSLEHSLASGGSASRVIVLSKSAKSEMSSNLTREDIRTLEMLPGVRLATPNVLTTMTLVNSSAEEASVPLRGVGATYLATHPETRLTSGHWLTSGKNELVVGKEAARDYPALQLGRKITFNGVTWIIVGIFESGAGAMNSTLIADAEVVLANFRRNSFQSATLTLTDANALTGLQIEIAKDARLRVSAHREDVYYKSQSRQTAASIYFSAYVIGTIMAVGAILGSLNAAFASLEGRTVELASLVAIGFHPLPVLVSIIAEATFLSIIGALSGIAVCLIFLNDGVVSASSGGLHKLAIEVAVTGNNIFLSLIVALVIGTLGGFIPAYTNMRKPVAKMLREF